MVAIIIQLSKIPLIALVRIIFKKLRKIKKGIVLQITPTQYWKKRLVCKILCFKLSASLSNISRVAPEKIARKTI